MFNLQSPSSVCEQFLPITSNPDMLKFPTLEAMSRILNATIAVRSESQENSAGSARICTGIALDKLILVVPGSNTDKTVEYCGDVGIAEDSYGKIMKTTLYSGNISNDVYSVSGNFKPARINIGNDISQGDVLIYSGYNDLGQRVYRRVMVAGLDENGQYTLVVNVDEVAPGETVENTADLFGNGGGLFDFEGNFITLLGGSYGKIDPLNIYNQEHLQEISEYNDSVNDHINKIGFENLGLKDTSYWRFITFAKFTPEELAALPRIQVITTVGG
ncbi:hypothetical protein KBC31_00770 [Candidatus Saccharibacteria bacterium]|jgi:hypothetical protein|nr:hypothetical protein [Candidatus Saccharibacteria bacterium]